nr:response regulator [Bdellovibrionales bacterium]
MNKVNILVVDDRPEGILSVQAVLTNPDYNLVVACSGAEALKHLLVYDFAVILLDVQMPIMDGFETAEMIKTRPASKDIPIIFMSAINQDEQYVYQGYNVGAVDYLLKPFDPYILRSKVAIFVEIFKKKLLIIEQARLLHENELLTYTRTLDRMEIESLKRYQYLADSIPQIVLQLRPDGVFQYSNKVWQIVTGLTDLDNAEMGWLEAIHPDDRKHFQNLENSRSSFEFEGRIKNHTGYRWHLFRFQPEFYACKEEISSWLGTLIDIEERKMSEDANRYLAQAGELLVSSLDYETTLKSIAELAVPQ